MPSQWQKVTAVGALFIVTVTIIYTRQFNALYTRHSKSASRATTASLRMIQNPAQPKRILVTGAAGFIGFHLSATLAADPSNTVIAMDNFNDYYDVRLKIDRAYELSKIGVTVYSDDLFNEAFVSELFERYNFTHVAHLAAQAGVRYSLQNPQAYIRANIQCQIVLFDTLKRYPHIRTAYASSSSVYGKEASVPFRLDALTDRPGNMYAATKKTDELLGLHYCRQYGLSMVGLRFFTVYGPWGRPDMAVFTFAEAMVQGKEVPLFQLDDPDKVLGRDFTYVDDIVSGIVASLNYIPALCGERFNLGFGHPVSVPDMLNIIEFELGTPAKIKKLPLPPSEILQTWADISASVFYLNFQPKTNLTVGVKAFISWYKDYTTSRKAEEKNSKVADAEIWYKGLEKEREERKQLYATEHIKQHNIELRARVEGTRARYMEWARLNGLQVPDLRKETFIFHQGVGLPSAEQKRSEFKKHPNLHNKIDELKEKCREFDQCVGFVSNGSLLMKITKPSSFQKNAFKGKTEGIYVADIDMCKADLYSCDRYEACKHEGPAQYSCYCSDAFKTVNSRCVPRHGFPVPQQLAWEYGALNFNMVNITEVKKTTDKMVFIEGLISDGGTYMVADLHKTDRIALHEICMNDAMCIGMTTDGEMKKTIKPIEKWTKVEQGGMFVYDFDYCLMDLKSCKYNHCTRQAEGKYICVKPKGNIATTPKLQTKTHVVPPPDLHVVFTFDEKSLKAMPAAMNSVAANTAAKVIFHLIVCGDMSKTEMESYLNCFAFDNLNYKIEIVQFDNELMDDVFMKYSELSDSHHAYLNSCGNYARFFIPRLLPDVKTAVYMDVDMAVRIDLNYFIQEANELHKYPLAFLDRKIKYSLFIRGNEKQSKLKAIFKEHRGMPLELNTHAYNAGFFVANLTLLREQQTFIHNEYHFWMEQNIKHKFWYAGTQTLMLLTFHHNVQLLHQSSLYVDALGYSGNVPSERINKGVLLHWNGEHKPWEKNGMHVDTWTAFLPTECHEEGTCTKHQGSTWQCVQQQ